MNDAKLDFLKELGNIGAGHAATALSYLLHGQKLDLIVPEAVMLSFDELGNFLGISEDTVVGIYIQTFGDAQGHMAFLLPLESAKNLLKYLTPNENDELNELELSALQEVGNIMVGSYLNALSTLTNMKLVPSVPAIAVDMAAAIWESILAGADAADTVTLIKTQFYTDNVEIEGHIIFLPNEEDFQKITQIFNLEDC